MSDGFCNEIVVAGSINRGQIHNMSHWRRLPRVPSSWRRRDSSRSRSDCSESARLQRLGRQAGAARQPTIKATPGARGMTAASPRVIAVTPIPQPAVGVLRLPTLQAIPNLRQIGWKDLL